MIWDTNCYLSGIREWTGEMEERDEVRQNNTNWKQNALTAKQSKAKQTKMRIEGGRECSS